MKTTNLLLTALLSGSLLAGCIDLSSDDKEAAAEAAKGLLDSFQEEASEETSKQDQLDGDYIANDDVTDAKATGGTASIGGEITPDSVSRKLLAKMAYGRLSSKGDLLSRALDEPNNTDVTVSYITGSGEVKSLNSDDLNIQVRLFEGNIQFVIAGLGDDINYIVQVIVSVDGEEQQPLKSVAFIPPGTAQAPKVAMDSVSTVVAEAVSQKVQNGFFETAGKIFSQDYIKDLSQTMAAVIAQVIQENPTDFSVTAFNDALENGGINALVSKLFSEPTVSESVNDLENTAVAVSKAPPTTLENTDEGRAQGREVIDDLYAQFDGEQGDGDENSTPSRIINFFGDRFAEGEAQHQSVEDIINAIFAGVDFSANTDQATELGLSKEGALSGFKTKLATIFSDIENIIALESEETLGAGDVTQLAIAQERNSGVPDIILALFPAKDRTEWAELRSDSQFTVPQAISLVFYVLDEYLAELKGFERNDDGQIEETDGVEFNTDFLLGLYGFDANDTSQQAQYAELGVNWLEVQPGRTWINSLNNGDGGEVDILSLFTCVDAYPEGVFNVNSVKVTYPTSSGEKTIELKNDSVFYANGDANYKSACFAVNPWAESELLAKNSDFLDDQDNVRWDDVWNRLLAQKKLVTEFASGGYKVTVAYSKNDVAQDNLVVDFSKVIITGLQNLTPKFTSPSGLPRAPDPGASPAEWTAFQAAQTAFNMTTFSDTDAVSFKWDEPEGLADILVGLTTDELSVIAVYNLNVGRDVCTGNDGCYWEHIFSSGELGGQIHGNSFELPDDIKAKLTKLELSDTPYQAGLNISFIDEKTGHHLGEGGWTGAPFRIGAVLDLDDTFTLTGSVSNVPGSLSASDIAQYKVAMILESCQEDESGQAQTHTFTDEDGNEVQETFFPFVCSSESLAFSGITASSTDSTYGYTLTPTLREAMSSTNNSWLSIRLFIDTDGDNLIDQGDANGNHETQFWSQDNVHFNAWGGVLRLNSGNCSDNECNFTEEVVLPQQTYDGPNFNVDQGDCCGGKDNDNTAVSPKSVLDLVGTYKVTSDNGDFNDYYAVITATDANTGVLFEVESSNAAGTDFTSCTFSTTSNITTTGDGVFTVTDTASSDTVAPYDVTLDPANINGDTVWGVINTTSEPRHWKLDTSAPSLASGC
jgi:hypothetical protein